MTKNFSPWLVVFACFCLFLGMTRNRASADDAKSSVGIFTDHKDIGALLHPGAAEYDDARKSYTVSGSGENMWAMADAFQYVYKQVSGDVSLAADIEFVGKGVEEHRKACLVIRQSLDADSPYADIALHGAGLTSLQFRLAKGEATHEVQSNLLAPRRLKIEKRGKYLYMYLAQKEGDELKMAGGSPLLTFTDPFYVGLAVCAHNKDVTEKAVFSNIEMKTELPALPARPKLYSTLETITVRSTDRRVTHVFDGRIEAPNWTKDNFLIYNGGGQLHKIDVDGKTEPVTLDTGNIRNINNDHAISFDGAMLAISASPAARQPSAVFTLPIGGGTPKRVTQGSEASYFHGWSPDGKTLAFCGQRNNLFDIYTIAADGSGAEKKLTSATAGKKEDGPEYSPDGKYIYFNSARTGTMQIWRMKPDGSEQEQLTSDDNENWFAHVAPNGQQMVFLTYEKGAGDHPADKDVMLRIMNLTDNNRTITVLTKLFGGQGTINVPSWSPDSLKLAFVSYQYAP